MVTGWQEANVGEEGEWGGESGVWEGCRRL
jgi:hypothetical protein